MSIETEINRISANVSDTLSAISEMGGEVPEGATSNDMASGVRSIPVGAKIDDITPSSTTTYSSQKIEAEISTLNAANAAQDTEIGKKVNDTDLAAVAKSGRYNDLTGKPTIPTVPTTLPNPNKLKLTGAVTAEYDGSAEVSVEIPAGGGYNLPIASATQLGGVMPEAKTDAMNQPVGVDANGRLYAPAAALPTDEQVGTAVSAYLTENPVSADGTFKGEILFSGETDGETSYWGTNDVVFEDGIYAVDMHKDSGVSTSKIISVYIGGATGGQTNFRMMHCSLAAGDFTANDAVTVFAVKNNTVRVLAATQNGRVQEPRDFSYFREGSSQIKGVWFGRQAWTSEILPAGITFRLWRLF